MDFTSLGIQIINHLLVTDTLKKGRGVDQKTSQYLVWVPFASSCATHLLCIELALLHGVCGCEAGWTYCQNQKWYWRRLMVEKLTFNSLATPLVDITAVSMPIARSLKTWDICGIVLCNKTAHLRVAFYCPQHKVHLWVFMLFNQLLDMPHLSGGWMSKKSRGMNTFWRRCI